MFRPPTYSSPRRVSRCSVIWAAANGWGRPGASPVARQVSTTPTTTAATTTTTVHGGSELPRIFSRSPLWRGSPSPGEFRGPPLCGYHSRSQFRMFRTTCWNCWRLHLRRITDYARVPTISPGQSCGAARRNRLIWCQPSTQACCRTCARVPRPGRWTTQGIAAGDARGGY